MTDATTTRGTTHKELHTGVAGNGNTKWMVVTVDNVSGRWLHIEEFTNQAEANAWLKYA